MRTYTYIPAGIPTLKHHPPDSELQTRDRRIFQGRKDKPWGVEMNHLTSILVAGIHSRREVVSSQYYRGKVTGFRDNLYCGTLEMKK